MELAEKFNEHPDICNAIGTHHDEIEMNALSHLSSMYYHPGSRPGARREIVESYIKRLKS